MKPLIALAAAAVTALALASSAFAHTAALTVSAVCNQAGSYDLTWEVAASNGSLSPVISDTDNGAVPVGSAVPKAFPQKVAGTTTSVSTTIKVAWSDGFTQKSSATAKLAGDCTPPVTPPPVEKIVYVDRPYAVEKIVYVDKVVTVEKVVEKKVPGPTVYVDRWHKGKTVYVDRWHKGKTKVVTIKVCPKPKPCPPGFVKLWDAKTHKYVCAVEGSG